MIEQDITVVQKTADHCVSHHHSHPLGNTHTNSAEFRKIIVACMTNIAKLMATCLHIEIPASRLTQKFLLAQVVP